LYSMYIYSHLQYSLPMQVEWGGGGEGWQLYKEYLQTQLAFEKVDTSAA
jgi:hypothetical protein